MQTCRGPFFPYFPYVLPVRGQRGIAPRFPDASNAYVLLKKPGGRL